MARAEFIPKLLGHFWAFFAKYLPLSSSSHSLIQRAQTTETLENEKLQELENNARRPTCQSIFLDSWKAYYAELGRLDETFQIEWQKRFFQIPWQKRRKSLLSLRESPLSKTLTISSANLTSILKKSVTPDSSQEAQNKCINTFSKRKILKTRAVLLKDDQSSDNDILENS